MLAVLFQRERSSEEFCDRLPSWRHSGFSVIVGTRITAGDVEQFELRDEAGACDGGGRLRDDGHVEITTKPDRKTGAQSIELNPLDFVHAVETQIPEGRKRSRDAGAEGLT